MEYHCNTINNGADPRGIGSLNEGETIIIDAMETRVGPRGPYRLTGPCELRFFEDRAETYLVVAYPQDRWYVGDYGDQSGVY